MAWISGQAALLLLPFQKGWLSHPATKLLCNLRFPPTLPPTPYHGEKQGRKDSQFTRQIIHSFTPGKEWMLVNLDLKAKVISLMEGAMSVVEHVFFQHA